MVLLGDSIRYSNVVSKKYSFHYSEMNAVMQSFLEAVAKAGATVKGPMFYSLNNFPLDEIMHVEFFMPVLEDRVELSEEMYFHSYYSVEDMITYCIHDQFETATEAAYGILMQCMMDNGLRQSTPIFHVLSGDRSMQYVFIKIGVVPEENEEAVWK